VANRSPKQRSRGAASPEAPAADDLVRREWLRRVEAEYRSGAHAQHLTLWLMQLGAPPDLVEMGLRIVSDELKHADLSDAVYREAGGSDSPSLSRDSLQLVRRPGEPLERDVLRVAVDMFCLGETVAVRLFTRLREGGTVPVVKRALDRILRDEVFHRDFGWTLLEWLLETPMAGEFRRQLAAELPDMLARIRRSYGGIALDKHGAEKLTELGKSLPAAARAWGVMPVNEYVEAVEETFARDYAPRFAALAVQLP
jgi:hypothetical protein